jgi:uncharacterized protein YbjT (DUF2867 family)
MNNKILVTGASGNIGTPLVANLKAANANFAVMRSKASNEAGFETVVADFNDTAALTRAFTGIDTLFLLLPLVENKLELAQNAATAAKLAGVKHIVRSSGAGAEAHSQFALPKLQGQIDDMLKATGIPYTFLRPAGFMQNYITYQTQAIKDGTIYMADGGQAQSLVDTRDIAEAAAKVLQNPAAHAGCTYNLTGGESITGVQAAALITQAIGKPVHHVSVSTEAAVATMQQWGMPAFSINILDSLNKVISAGYASDVSMDVENLLGRKPRTFAGFVADNAAAWK